jgi:hypothetical protein
MPNAIVDLKAFTQTKQVLASPNGDEMYGRVLFDITVDGTHTADCHVDVKLVVGGTYEVDAIEVGRPVGYRGPFNQARFAECIQRYVHGAVGTNGWGIRLGPGSSNVVMLNCRFARLERCSFEAAADGAGW